MEEAREREEQEMKQRHKASTGTASHLACFVPQLNTGWGSRTDKSYPDGQSASSSLIIEPVAVRVCALGITLAHILKLGPSPSAVASLNCGTGTVLYGRGQLGSI